MKRTDKEILEMLGKELEKSTESVEVPLKLRKESVVAMLKNSEKEEKDFSAKTGNNSKIIAMRRIVSIAAVFVVVVVAALFMRNGGVRVIKADTFYKGYERVEPVKSARSYEDVEKAVQEILNQQKENNKKPQTDSTEPDSANQSTTQGVIDRIIGNYSGDSEENMTYTAEPKGPEAPQGVITYSESTADIVKTDGKYIYIVKTGIDSQTGGTVEQIKIVKADPAAEMQVASTIVLADGANAGVVDECIEIHLKDNRLIAIMNSYTYSMDNAAAYNRASTVAVYYDISNPSAPVKIREHKQEGSYVSSGFNKNKLCLVTNVSLSAVIANNSEKIETIIPSFSVDGVSTKLTADEVFIAQNYPEASFLFITVTDVSDLKKPVGRLAVLGSGKDVYCLENTVAVARGFTSEETKPEVKSLTEIYRFETGGSEIAFAGSFVANGSLSGGISIDEENGNIKLLTYDAGANNFYILNKKMEYVSGLTGIFPNEKVKSIKYIGSNAYFVAGDDNEKTVIVDISDPSKPKAAGNISTEGFSQELYAVSDTALLGIGSAENGSVRISLFDVSNPNNPEAVSEYILEGSFSLPSVDDGRCVLLDSEKMLFGIPVVNHTAATDTDISAYILFNVADGKITPVGTYNHDTSCTGDAAVRGLCVGNTLYTVSGEKVAAFDIEKCTLIASQTVQ